jgi:hypothetical protein
MERRVFYGGVRAKLDAVQRDLVDGSERNLDEGERRGAALRTRGRLYVRPSASRLNRASHSEFKPSPS